MSAPSPPRTGGPFAAAQAVADTVLYEGYVLYPYRASSSKNRLRWQFGVLAPRAWAAADGSERWSAGTQVVVDPGQVPTLSAQVRCLHVEERVLEAGAADGRFTPVDRMEVDGVIHVPFDEAVEHDVDLEPVSLLPMADGVVTHHLDLDGASSAEPLLDRTGTTVGRVVRTRRPVEGDVRVSTRWADGPGALLHVAVEVENTTDASAVGTREEALRRSLVAVHVLLAVDDGVFVSVVDPPEGAAEAVAGCRQDGLHPVLVGEPDAHEAPVVLASPIILYDHPAIAPESAGDLFDATEIDEILALRVLTLTDEEKAEARGSDPRAAAIVDRVDDMPPEMWSRLHGAIRTLQPVDEGDGADELPWWEPAVDEAVDPWTDTTVIEGVAVGAGTKVVLRPTRRADAHDLFLAGQRGTVAGVFRDVDDELHLAISLDDDPAREVLEWQRRYYYFRPEEVELVR